MTKNRGGRPVGSGKSVEEHLLAGTYRQDRHGPLRPATPLCSKPAPRPKTQCGDPGKWARNAADEYAIGQGCWFDEQLADYVVGWFRNFLRHSKGKWAGEPFELLDWQREEIVYPLFGWLRPGGTRRFRITYIELPKKNGKSTLASGIGLYMLCGDGEQGAEVYSTASDRDQASIVHGEAINMVEAMLEADQGLRSVLKINHTNKNILYAATKSYYRAISSKPQGKEGLNGNCCICDELHVWYGDELWNALKFMGRSRAQPLRFVITTAGDDPESICFRQHEYAKAVLDGAEGYREDIRFFALIRGVEKDEDYTTPEARQKANPSMGITIDEEEFVADLEEAKRTPSSLASFLRYSFNVWSTSKNPWIDIADWDACKRDFTEDDLLGKECWLGLDLSKTRDTTAAVLVFPDPEDDEGYFWLPYFWLPRDTAEAQRHLVQWPTWEQQGHITLTDENYMDYARVRADIEAMCDKFLVRKLIYDNTYADNLTRDVEESKSVERNPFGQTMMNFAGPAAEWERLILSRKIRHNGHPVMRWQVGNAQVKTDSNGNKRPTKASPDDYRKIDGVVAGLMALSGAVQERDRQSAYEDRGLLVF